MGTVGDSMGTAETVWVLLMQYGFPVLLARQYGYCRGSIV